jgi:hypothetical protein
MTRSAGGRGQDLLRRESAPHQRCGRRSEPVAHDQDDVHAADRARLQGTVGRLE